MKDHFNKVSDVFMRHNGGVIIVQDGWVSDGIMIVECDPKKLFPLMKIEFDGFGVYKNIRRGDNGYNKVDMVSYSGTTIKDLYDTINLDGNHLPVFDSNVTYHIPINLEGKRNRFVDVRCYIPNDEKNKVYTIKEEFITLFDGRDLYGSNDGKIVFTKSEGERVAIAIFQLKGEQQEIMINNIQILNDGLNIMKGV